MNFRDTIGFAWEAAATGAVAVTKSLMAYMKQLVSNSENMNAAQLIVGNINILYPDVDQPAAAIEFTLHDANGGFIGDAQISDVGQIDIYRYRKGTDAGWTQIVNAAAPSGTALGTLNYSYAYPNASWAAGDLVQVHVSSVGVTKNSKVFTVPRVTAYAVVGFNQVIQDWQNGGRLDLILDDISADLGNFSGQTNLKSLLAVLGVPDVAGDTLYKLLITDRLDNATYGLSALETLVDDLESKLATGAGSPQVKAATIDLHQAAGDYDLFTGATQDVVLERLCIRLPNVNVADDATITSISIQTNDATPQVLVSSALGAKANLTAEAQIFWTGLELIKTGRKIQLTIAGGASDAETVCDVVAEYRAVAAGGTLT